MVYFGFRATFGLATIALLGLTPSLVTESQARPSPGTIVINEIHYDAPDNTIGEEFIELHNPGPSAVDLSGWRISGAVDCVVADGTSIAPDGFLVIAENPKVLRSQFHLHDDVPVLGPYAGRLSNDEDGETVRLRDVDDKVVDRVDYRVGFPWPVGALGDGPSIELIHHALDNELGSSWRAAQKITRDLPASTTYLSASDDNWHYRKGRSNNPPRDGSGNPWFAPGYNEADDTVDWATGARTPIGYGDGDDNTVLADMRGNYSTVYLRNSFTVPDKTPGNDLPAMIMLRLYVDDGCIAYINGNEVARESTSRGAKHYDATTGQSEHERAWETFSVTAAQGALVEGKNTIAIHVHNATLFSSDLSIDAEVRTPGPEEIPARPTPGVRNSVFATNAPPNIRQVDHWPEVPRGDSPAVVTAKVTDPDGVALVQMHYQIVSPGNYIPSKLPLPVTDNNIDTALQRPGNPAFDSPANWMTVPMMDDGGGDDAGAGDTVFTATIPGQPHRTLVRYRITVADLLGKSVRVPYDDDASLNFAYFVYDGVPRYNGHSVEVLESLPVYHLITRGADYSTCLAYRRADQIDQGTQARFLYNWNGTLFYEGKVYDHIRYRLRGANGRYDLQGKRSMRVRFNPGSYFQARDQFGKKYRQKWRTLTTGKGFDNRGTLTFALNEALSLFLFNTVGVPASETHWVHWRVIDGVEEAPDRWQGDFHGLNFILESYDERFLEAHELAKGNLYKFINQTGSASKQQRYQARHGVIDGSDHDHIELHLDGRDRAAYIRAHVNMDKWNRYHALAEAIRHYDLWPSGNKNMVYYFEPDYQPANSHYGKLWMLPWDTDLTWGPAWNAGHDVVYNALFNTSNPLLDADKALTQVDRSGSDSGTTPELWPEYFNTVRELCDLLWQPDQINPLVDEFASFILHFEEADADRWKAAPDTAGNYDGLRGAGASSLADLVQDMKNFAFHGGRWPGGSVGRGGRAAHLDQLQGLYGEAGRIPDTPTITYAGEDGFPADGLVFRSTRFSDPQGGGSFGAMEWRIAEITDTGAHGHGPKERFKLEWKASWESGKLAVYDSKIRPPASAVHAGRSYRARLRHQDKTGRWSHWSLPLQFTATLPDLGDYLNDLMITEVMYHPAKPNAAERTAGFTDDGLFEYIELKNLGKKTLDLENVRFTKGVDFDFSGSAMTTLAPGRMILVVKDQAAFTMRYGAGLPVAGQWQSTDKLDNAGERLKLSFGAGAVIREFVYDDKAPWPASADGAGPSLTLIEPARRPDPRLPVNWRASSASTGTPGVEEALP